MRLTIRLVWIVTLLLPWLKFILVSSQQGNCNLNEYPKHMSLWRTEENYPLPSNTHLNCFIISIKILPSSYQSPWRPTDTDTTSQTPAKLEIQETPTKLDPL